MYRWLALGLVCLAGCDIIVVGNEPFTFGDDPFLDLLWLDCEDGDFEACDDLFLSSPSGSDYEFFGDTCGERQLAGTDRFCVETFGF